MIINKLLGFYQITNSHNHVIAPGCRVPKSDRIALSLAVTPTLFASHSTMDSADISDFDIPHGDPHLLSESLLFPSSSSTSSRTGPGGADLSLSELLLPDKHAESYRRPFSLLAHHGDDENRTIDAASVEEDYDDENGLRATVTQEDVENAQRLAAKTREDKLQHDLFILKKLNSAFEVYKTALRETKSGTEVSSRV